MPDSEPFSVGGKTAIVTGAGSGINLCFASLLLSKGCNVLFCDLALRPEAKDVVDQYSAKSSDKPRAVFLQTDVREWSQLSRMFQTADAEFGGVDLVCPGAGVFEPHWSNFWHPPGSSKSKDDPDGNTYATLDINVTHPIRTTQLAISHFLSPPNGLKASSTNPKRVLLITSIAGYNAAPSTPLYFASKHAIVGFARSLGDLDGTLGIRVNAVAPGIIKTPLWLDHPEKLTFIDQSRDTWTTPEEVADAMLTLVEDENMPGGTILEVGHESTRKVTQEAPTVKPGEGLSVSNLDAAVQEVYGWLGEENWGKVTQPKE